MVQSAAVTLRNSLVTENREHGMVVWAFSGETAAVDVEQSQIAENAVGINAFTVGGAATVRVAASRIVGNGIGLQVGAGAGLVSFGNNRLAGNGTDGAFTARIAEE
jgi:hypothetical protein